MSGEYVKAMIQIEKIEGFADFADWLEGQGWWLYRPVDGGHEAASEIDWMRLIFKYCDVDYDKYMEETVPKTVEVELPDDPV